MPNWCDNKLTVSGDPAEVGRFREDGIREGKWAMGNYLPMPDGFNDGGWDRSEEEKALLMEKYGATDWYVWRLKNYGCKWDCEVDEYDIETRNGAFTLYFDSPWSPPIAFVKKMQERYPKLHFRLAYMETGVFFAGVAETQDDGEGSPEIYDVCGEPEYRTADGNPILGDDAALEEYIQKNPYIVCNPFETDMYYESEPDNCSENGSD